MTTPNDDDISQPSKRAIAAIHLLSKIFYDYLCNDEYQCPFIPDDIKKYPFINLLDFIHVKDPKQTTKHTIHCIIETMETSKIYRNHLKEYHSTKKQQTKECLCLLWKYHRYTLDLDENESKQPHQHDISFKKQKMIINAPFFMQIISMAQILNNKISIHNTFSNKWEININQALIYHNIDLNGVQFIFSDEISKNSSIHQLHLDIVQESLENDKDNMALSVTEYESTTFGDIYRQSMNGINYNIFNTINDYKCIHQRYDTNDTPDLSDSATGMVYCCDYDEEDAFSDVLMDDDCSNDDRTSFKFNKHLKINIQNHASSPMIASKKHIKDELSVKSVVNYDSNKHYVPFNGYGLQFKSQSDVSMNSELPCGGKISSITTDGSVICFDD